MSEHDSLDLPRRTVLGGLAALVGLGAGAGTSAATQNSQLSDHGPGLNLDVEVTQPEGKPVNWVLPAPRRLSEEVFGTPDNPLMGDDLIEHVKEQRPEMADLLDDMPFEVGVPEDMRETNEAGDAFTVTTEKTPFGDEHHPTDGKLDLVYKDRAPWAKFPQGRDEIEFDAWFTDPAGNRYTAEIGMLDRETKEHAGGVLVGGLIHGATGIGSPLMTKMYNYASFWGVGRLEVNGGEEVWENRVIHFMTTQMVRDNDYALALDEEMPLADPYLGGAHHTHGIFPPIEMTKEGPQFSPLNIPFPEEKENGQPFIHIMYDLDEVEIRTV